MAASVVPALIDALVAAADAALTGVTVYDGVGVSEDPGDYLMVGVEDPDSDDAANSAESSQEWATAIGALDSDESGEITCLAVSWNGDGNQKTARDAAYAIAEGLFDAIHTDPDLGVAGLLWARFGSRMQLNQAQGESGAAALLTFRVAFRARI